MAQELNFEQIQAELWDILDRQNARSSWDAFRANAKLAKARRLASPLQEAALVTQAEVTAWADMIAQSQGRLCPANDDAQTLYPNGFPESVTGSLGVYYCPVSDALKTCALKEFTHGPLHLARAGFLIGTNGLGKSLLQRAIGRYFCEAYGKSAYLVTQGLDPLGLATRAGMPSRIGAALFADVEMESGNRVRLTLEHIKGLLLIYEPAHLPARFNGTILPALIPRIFSCNRGSQLHSEVCSLV